ncbi:hypothetical protein QQ045_004875 [Rhodiola kirilowii]
MVEHVRKRSRHPSRSPSLKCDRYKRSNNSHSPANIKRRRSKSPETNQRSPIRKPTNFPSYLDKPDLTPKVSILCQIVATTEAGRVEKVLDDTGIRVCQDDVEDVLKLSYGSPGPVVKFFRWSGHQFSDKHSPYAWNLVVDMLGKNGLFDAMWDAIKSMKAESLVSLATFASVFSSYVVSDRVKEAIMTFEVMNQYGVSRDIVALNSLLSAICRDGKTSDALEFMQIAKDKIRPDADTYAILLEGLEKVRDAFAAKKFFNEMVMDIGWDPRNVPAYNSYLNTLLRGPDGRREAIREFEVLSDRRCFPGTSFLKNALAECVKCEDSKRASILWEDMVGRNVCRPDTDMYNSMISLHCQNNDGEMATRLMDEMVFMGAFPDSQTYNVLLRFFTKAKKLHVASIIFTEMVKNECTPSKPNCGAAMKTFLDLGDPYMAINVWKCMLENYDSDLVEAGNMLIVGLRDLKKIPEAVKYAEGLVERGIKLNSSTWSKLKQSLVKQNKAMVYDELLKKWKTR